MYRPTGKSARSLALAGVSALLLSVSGLCANAQQATDGSSAPASEAPADATSTVPADATSTTPAEGADAGPDATESEADEQEARLANGTRFGAWMVTCEALAVDETACVLSQRLLRSGDNAFLAELVAFWDGDLENRFLAAYVPVGVYFPSGLALRPESAEEQIALVWQSCSRERCEALIELDDAVMAELADADPVIMGYRPSATAEPLVFRSNMSGLEEGLSRLQSALSSER